MKVKAAIALEKAKPLIVDYVDLEGPKKGEVLVEIKSTVPSQRPWPGG